MPVITARPLRAVAMLLLAALVSTACSHHKHVAAPPPPPPTHTPKPPPPPPTSPLTGLLTRGVHYVLAVKIDNTAPAHPQTGLNDADLVYIEQVEAGLTRIMAIYASHYPATIGPVRSVRESDLQLLAEYGKVAFAFSGGNSGVINTVDHSFVVADSPDTAGDFYFRSGARHAPYNLYLTPTPLMRVRKGIATHDIGLRFNPVPPRLPPSTGFTVHYPLATVTWLWDARAHLYRLVMDGAPAMLTDGGQITATNVIVQFVRLTPSRYVDVLGNPTPFTVTVGGGHVAVFRDGTRIDGSWLRPRPNTGTRLLAGRADIGLRPGRSWVLLVPDGTPLTRA